MAENKKINKKKKVAAFSGAMILVAMGIVYGDIATSPMYVMKSIVAGNGGYNNIDSDFIIGALSLVIWTITLLTTIKHVVIAMKADNNGEGGIFALYSLIKKHGKWLLIPAMIGGASLLADSILTPAVTVTTAVEGLKSINLIDSIMFTGHGHGPVLVIVVVIISILFFVQRAGTSVIGKAFGPIMTIWFLFLAFAGIMQIINYPLIFKAFNPWYAIQILISPNNKVGFMILGSVFLATTGAEALYSDMGHVGKKSIYISWPFVKASLILNYLGQGAWIISKSSTFGNDFAFNPFYEMLEIPGIRIMGVVLGAIAAIIASQALITGSFSIVSEAIKLDLMPHMQTFYPSETRGQIYIPLVNNLLWAGCIVVVLFFKTSAKMEAAYGLAITITLLMVTILLTAYLIKIKHLKFIAFLFAAIFGFIELIFFISCAGKFIHGGYVAILIAFLIFLVMVIWNKGTQVEKMERTRLKLSDYIPKLEDLKNDTEIPWSCDNLIFLTASKMKNSIEHDILYSILDKKPKRAKVYWFVHLHTTRQPFGANYSVENFGTDFVFRVTIRLGYKEDQRLNIYMRKIFTDLLATGELKPQFTKHTVYSQKIRKKWNKAHINNLGSVKYCLIKKSMLPESNLSAFAKWAISWKYKIRHFAGSPIRWYGLENSSVIAEYVPFFIDPTLSVDSFVRK